MSFLGSGMSSPRREEDGSLQSILHTPALRVELAAVVAICSDAMRRDLLKTFELPDAYQRHPKNPARSSTVDNLLSDQPPRPTKKPHYKVLEEAELRDRLEEDIHSSQTQGLRRAATVYLDRWQVDVLRRLGEVLQVRPDAVKVARAKAKAQAEAKAKERLDKRYRDWANGIDQDPADEANTSNSSWGVALDGFNLAILRMERSKRVLIVDSVLLLLLSLEHYTAHSRILMLRLTHTLELPTSTLIDNEAKVARGLLASAASQMQAEESTKRKADEDATQRRWKVGLATVAGAALIGVTGGLAAPFLAAGIGSIMGGLGLGAVATLLGPLATNVVLVGGLFGAYGGRMTGQIMEKYAQEVRDFKFVPIAPRPGSAHEDYAHAHQATQEQQKHELRVNIGISGWLETEQDITSPWSVISGRKTESFALRFEREALGELGQSLSSAVKSFAWDFAKWQILSSIVAGLWPLALLRNARMLDNPFAIAKNRSTKAGKVLADALINKAQGERPVTLIGYSLGARVIYSCLVELAEQNAFGLVESAVLIGAPAPSDFEDWRKMRAVVSGRLVNVYSRDDLMLAFLYRASSAQMGIAGLSAVEHISGVENYDFTDMVKGHTRYRLLVGSVLQRAGFDDIDMDAVQQQQQALREAEVQQKKPATIPEHVDRPELARDLGDGRIIMVDEEGHEQGAAFQLRGQPDAASEADPPQYSRESEGLQDPPPTYESGMAAIQLEDEENPSLIENSQIAPEPEPDQEPERETVRFGSSSGRGFSVEWDSRQERDDSLI